MHHHPRAGHLDVDHCSTARPVVSMMEYWTGVGRAAGRTAYAAHRFSQVSAVPGCAGVCRQTDAAEVWVPSVSRSSVSRYCAPPSTSASVCPAWSAHWCWVDAQHPAGGSQPGTVVRQRPRHRQGAPPASCSTCALAVRAVPGRTPPWRRPRPVLDRRVHLAHQFGAVAQVPAVGWSGMGPVTSKVSRLDGDLGVHRRQVTPSR